MSNDTVNAWRPESRAEWGASYSSRLRREGSMERELAIFQHFEVAFPALLIEFHLHVVRASGNMHGGGRLADEFSVEVDIGARGIGGDHDGAAIGDLLLFRVFGSGRHNGMDRPLSSGAFKGMFGSEGNPLELDFETLRFEQEIVAAMLAGYGVPFKGPVRQRDPLGEIAVFRDEGHHRVFQARAECRVSLMEESAGIIGFIGRDADHCSVNFDGGAGGELVIVKFSASVRGDATKHKMAASDAHIQCRLDGCIGAPRGIRAQQSHSVLRLSIFSVSCW